MDNIVPVIHKCCPDLVIGFREFLAAAIYDIICNMKLADNDECAWPLLLNSLYLDKIAIDDEEFGYCEKVLLISFIIHLYPILASLSINSKAAEKV